MDHPDRTIYLDHNATTPLHPRVLEAMQPYLTRHWGNPSSLYRPGREAKAAIESARRRIADCLGCEPGEIVFTAGGTEADNLAVRGTVRARRDRGDHVVTSAIEHHAVLHTCKALQADGVRVTYLPACEDGRVDVDALASSVGPRTVLVSVMLANNETGVINPIAEIGRIAAERGCCLHTDAVQALGKIPIDLRTLGADMAAFAGHKIYGPKGIGLLYVKRAVPLVPILTGGSHEHGLRAGTENVAGIVGLAEAVVLACETLEAEAGRLSVLRDRLETRICRQLDGVRVNGGRSPRVPNTSNLSFDRVDGESIVVAMDLEGICISTGSACSTGDPEPSHVLIAMGCSPAEAQGSVRISLGKDTTQDEIDLVVQALVDTVQRLREISSID